MEKFRSLLVWKKAHELVLSVYKATNSYPKRENYALVDQMRRAAVSIPANIAEGSKRVTPKDRKHFMVMADGSLEELKYYFILSYSLRYLDRDSSKKMYLLSQEVGRMLSRFIKAI